MIEFRILGPLEAAADGRALDLGGQKQRAVLAMLLLEPNRVVASSRLIDAVWEDEPPETARKALQVYVSQLRKVLGKDRVETRPAGYLLRVEADELDLDRFRDLQQEGRHTEALALWRDAPLADFGAWRFAQIDTARLDEERLSCLEDRIEGDMADGRHNDLVGELDALVRAHPLRQRLRGQLMLALYRSGRDVEALEAYQDARRLLVDELGIEPRRELRDLQQAILNQDPALDLVPAHQPAADSAGGTALVGRERELAALLAGLDDAFAGRGRLLLLVGEPGIGKSRLAEELGERARARGARVLVGRCWEAGGAPAYWPWVQALRSYIGEADPGTLRDQLGGSAAHLAQLLPELRALLPDLPEPQALEPESARFRLFEAITALLSRAGEVRPIVLVLDDLHAADAPSLMLLRFVARELGSGRLLVIAAYRDVDPTPADALTETVTELAREPTTSRIALTGLESADIARFIELIAEKAPSDALVATIEEETQGNPLFVGEIVRLLAAEGRLDTGGAPRVAIPQSVREVIARRLGHLSSACNQVLVLSSVLGREFDLAALSQLAAVSEDDLFDTLDEAMGARVVSDIPGSPGRLRFSHVLIRDTLYEELTTVRRVRLHRLAVAALEVLYGDTPGPHLAELAHHAIAGSDFERGLRYAWQAGDRALVLIAYEEAAELYETALGALELTAGEDEQTRCELLLSLGEANSRAGDLPAARDAFLAAAEIARALRRSSELARAAAGYGGRIVWARGGDDTQLVPLIEEALALLPEENAELRARLLARLAGALRDEPSRDRRDSHSREAVELARRVGDPSALAYALDGRAAAIYGPDTAAECLTLSNELLQVAEQIGDPERISHGLFQRFAAQLQLGKIEQAEADLTNQALIAEQLRQPAQLWQAYSGQAMLALSRGRLSEAESLTEQAFTVGKHALAGEFALSAYTFQLLTLRDFQERLEEVENVVREAVAAFPARPVFRCALAYLDARLGRTDDAAKALRDLTNDRSSLPFDMEWLLGMSLLAETSAILDDTDAAANIYELLLPWATLNVADAPEAIRGSVSRYLGILAALLEHWKEAMRHFEHALKMNEHMGLRPWLAHTQHDYAQMLTHGGQMQQRASEINEAAISACRDLGISPRLLGQRTQIRQQHADDTPIHQ